MDKCHVLPEQVSQILPNGEKRGSYKPTSEWKMHYNAYLVFSLRFRDRYAERSEIGAIVHTHSPALLTFALSHNIPETRIFPLISQFLGEVAMVPYRICGSDKLVPCSKRVLHRRMRSAARFAAIPRRIASF